MAGAVKSRELLDVELLLEPVTFLLFGASCSLKSSVCCSFEPEALFSSVALTGGLAFPFFLESFRAGRSG